MHEASIAQGIIRAVEERIEEGVITGRVSKVLLRVGRLRAVVPENLEFLFEILARGSALEGSRLDIEFVPVKATCKRCDMNLEIVELGFLCPHCRSADLEVITGAELLISAVEVD